MAYGSVLTDTVQSSTAATAPVFKDGNGTQIGTLCRAWVNFNGTGTVAIRASFNVSSITDNGTGDYTVNFTTAMPDANYSIVTQGTSTGKGYTVNAPKNASSSNIGTGSVTLITADFNGNTADYEYVFISIFR